MNTSKLALVGYGGEGLGTPISEQTLHRMLDAADPPTGGSALDLGCGCGQGAALLAARGLRVTAVERHAAVAEAARVRTQALGPRVQVICAEASDVDAAAGHDLVVALGAGALVGRDAEPAQVLAFLAERTRPGGRVLWGETFWRRAPSPLLHAVAGAAGRYGSHADYVRAGLAAGLVPLHAGESSQAEWDDYVFRYVRALELYAAANPDDPDAEPMRNRGRAWRDLYLAEAREVMGFGLYLFGRPA